MRTLLQQRPFFILHSVKGRLLLARLLMHTPLFILILMPLLSLLPPMQTNKPATPQLPVQLLTRSTRRHESSRFSYGGTVTLIGAPRGSVTVEGWNRDEVELTADIEWKAESEAELDQLAKINNFVFDEDLNHISILTVGTHDRAFMKKNAKNFPKKLLNLPWKIDYQIGRASCRERGELWVVAAHLKKNRAYEIKEGDWSSDVCSSDLPHDRAVMKKNAKNFPKKLLNLPWKIDY